MALSVSLTDSSGVTSTYWTINQAHADFVAKTVSVAVMGYLDAAANAAGKSVASRQMFNFVVPFSDIPSTANGTISMSELYNAVLAQINNPKRAAPHMLAGATLTD